eukprot:scaffold7998_cov417-Prasinococcus_capsulatus_cf.AAC.4
MEEQVCERLEGSIQLATQNHIHTTVVEGAKDMAQKATASTSSSPRINRCQGSFKNILTLHGQNPARGWPSRDRESPSCTATHAGEKCITLHQSACETSHRAFLAFEMERIVQLLLSTAMTRNSVTCTKGQ